MARYFKVRLNLCRQALAGLSSSEDTSNMLGQVIEQRMQKSGNNRAVEMQRLKNEFDHPVDDELLKKQIWDTYFCPEVAKSVSYSVDLVPEGLEDKYALLAK